MAKQRLKNDRCFGLRRGKPPLALTALLTLSLAFSGCFDPVYPQKDREDRIMEALGQRENRLLPVAPLSPGDAVAYALANNLDSRVAEVEAAYQNESLVASRRRLLPSLTARYSMDHSNHPSARWSESTRSGNQSLESSYSSEPNTRRAEISAMWNLIDFGVGYLRSRQQGEKVRYAEYQRQRVRQQVVLDVLSAYWRAAAAQSVATQAEALKEELEEQARAIRDSVDMRILSVAEGARRELAVHNGLSELEAWRRAAVQAKLELARVMGSGSAVDFTLQEFPADIPRMPALIESEPQVLQTAALKRRPELYQFDAQERIAEDEARAALLQMAPNVNLSLGLNNDPDKFLEWNSWMTAGARASWNLLNIPARLSERRMAKLQGEIARQKGLALAMAVMAQVGIAYSDWRLSHEYMDSLHTRAAARERLVEALAAGEKDNQTRPGEVLQERVRLLSDKSAAIRAASESRIAAARLANAIGVEVNGAGEFVWNFMADADGENYDKYEETGKGAILYAESRAAALFPTDMAGLRVVKAEEFLTPDSYFEENARLSAAMARAEDEVASISEPAAVEKAATPEPAPQRKRKRKVAKAAPESGHGETANRVPADSTGEVAAVVLPTEEVASSQDMEAEAKQSTAESRPRTKPVPVKRRKPAGPPNVAEGDMAPGFERKLPEDLQALVPSADAFGADELPRNAFIDRRFLPSPVVPFVEPAAPVAVPAGSLRPEGMDAAPTEQSLHPSFDIPLAPVGGENASLRPPAASPALLPEGGTSFVEESLSWEESRLRALELLPTIE